MLFDIIGDQIQLVLGGEKLGEPSGFGRVAVAAVDP